VTLDLKVFSNFVPSEVFFSYLFCKMPKNKCFLAIKEHCLKVFAVFQKIDFKIFKLVRK